MKKLLSLVLALAMMLSMAACSSAPASSETTDPGVEIDPTTIAWDGYEQSKGLEGTISMMHWGDDYERQMYENVINRYMELVPGVTVEQLYVPGDYYTKLQTLAASNQMPDLYWVAEGRTAEYASTGYMMDLAPVLADYPAILEGYAEGALVYGQYDGVQYALPKDFTGYCMFINEDMFAEAGLEVPTGDWTMDEYLELAEKLTIKSGDRTVQYGTAVSNYRADWINFMGNFDAAWFKDGKSNISDPNAIKGLSYQAKLVEEGWAPTPGVTEEGEDRLFITGQLAMYASGRWVMPSFMEEIDFNWTAVEMPTGTTKVSPFITSNVAIAPSCENVDVAANFYSFFFSEEALKLTLAQNLSLPLYDSLLTDDFLAEPNDAFIACADYLGDAEQVEALMTGKWSEYNSIFYAEMQLVFDGQKTLEQAAADIDKQANETVFK
jgi:multiple sugar transport system substrate-binding protein